MVEQFCLSFDSQNIEAVYVFMDVNTLRKPHSINYIYYKKGKKTKNFSILIFQCMSQLNGVEVC